MIQVDRNITMDEVNALELGDHQLEAFRKLQTLYENDILLMDPMQLSAEPKFSEHQLKHVSYGSVVNFIKYILKIDETQKQFSNNLRKNGVPLDANEQPMIRDISEHILNNQQPI